MSRSLSSSKATFKTQGSLQNTLTDGTISSISQPALNYSLSLSTGVAANQANRAWQTVSSSIASGEQVTINLNDFVGFDIGGGDGKDALGQSMDLEEIVMIAIKNENTVSASGILEIKPAVSEGWNPIGTHDSTSGGGLRGQGILIKAQPAEAGFDVDPEIASRITLTAVGAAVTYSVYIFGRSDDEESSSSSSSSSSASSSSQSSSQSTSSVSTSSSSISTSSNSSVSSQSESSSSSSVSSSSQSSQS